MRYFTPMVWRYVKNQEGTYTVCPVEDSPLHHVVAIVMREEDARLISAAPQLEQALIYAVDALRATKAFMADKGMDTDDLSEIVRVIGGLLDRIDGSQEG